MGACDALLVFAQKEKLDLERKRRNLGEAIENLRERIDLLGKEYVQVQSLLDAYTSAYHILPEGSKDKVSIKVEVKRLELRQARLDKKNFTCNVHTLLVKEVHYNKLDSQVSAVETFILTVQRKKTALKQAGLRVKPVTPSLRPPASRQKTLPAKKSEIVYPKQQPAEKMYNFSGHFLDPCDCTYKTVACKKHVQFSSA